MFKKRFEIKLLEDVNAVGEGSKKLIIELKDQKYYTVELQNTIIFGGDQRHVTTFVPNHVDVYEFKKKIVYLVKGKESLNGENPTLALEEIKIPSKIFSKEDHKEFRNEFLEKLNVVSFTDYILNEENNGLKGEMDRYGMFINSSEKGSGAGYGLVGMYEEIGEINSAIKGFSESALLDYDSGTLVINVIDFELGKFVPIYGDLDGLDLYTPDTWKKIDIKGQGRKYFK